MADKREFIRDYRAIDRDRNSPSFGVRFSYGRRFAQIVQDPFSRELTLYTSRRDRILRSVHIPVRSSILFVGGGFGFLQESFALLGYSKMNSLDNSSYVNQSLHAHATHETIRNFINIDVLGDVSPLGSWDFVISDNVTPTIPLANRRVFLENCSLLGKRVIHLVASATEARTPGIKQWHREAPRHVWIDSNGSKVGNYGN